MKALSRKALSLLLVLAMCAGFFTMAAVAADGETVTVQYDVTYQQSMARDVLQYVNAFRTSDDTWYWNEDNETKTWVKDLNELVYDYDLEAVAMQRAAELAVKFAHVKPDGRDFSTWYRDYSSVGLLAENIAAGSSNSANSYAEGVFTGWREEDEYYADQGHRRNMLAENCTTIGIACVYCNGYYYWAMELGNPRQETNTTDPTDANDASTSVTAEISTDVLNLSVNADVEDLSMKKGETAALPELTGTSEMTYPSSRTMPVTFTDIVWTSSNTNAVTISDGQINAVGGGSATISAVVAGQTVSFAVEVHEATEIPAVAPKCTEPGNIQYWYCQTCGKYFSDEEMTNEISLEDTVIPATGHSWGEPDWIWDDDAGDSASAKFTCTACGDSETVEAVMTYETKDPTCTTPGQRICSATVEFNGRVYETSKTIETDPLGHTWADPVWVWDGTDPSVTRTCTVCGTGEEGKITGVSSSNISPTCTEDGREDYTATAVFSDGETTSDSMTIIIPAPGHSWGEPDWSWTDSGEIAFASFICSVCKEGKIVEADMDDETIAPTCTDPGQRIFYATVELDGSVYTTSRTIITGPATGHTWADPVWVWDGTDPSVTRTCTVCWTVEEGEITGVSSSNISPTCTEDGREDYTATAVFSDGETTSDSMTIVIPAPGHSWEGPDWSWTDDGGTIAFADFICSVCGVGERLTADMDYETIEPTCTEPGQLICNASVELDGIVYTTSKTIITEPATGHTWADPVWVWDGTDPSVTRTCTACKTVEKGTITGVASSNITPTCTENGREDYTATAVFSDGSTTSDSMTIIIPATGHSWEGPDWSWTDDGGTIAFAEFICSVCGDGVRLTADMTYETIEPTCTEPGQLICNASVELDGSVYTTSRTINTESPTGHTWGDDVTWTWDYSNHNVISAVRTCTVCGTEDYAVDFKLTTSIIYTPCDENNKETWDATAIFSDGTEAYDSIEEEIPGTATNHTWGTDVEWTWDGYNAVSAVRTCEVCGAEDYGEIVMVLDYRNPTCTEDGYDSYNATAVFSDGYEAYDSVRVTIPATGHTWGEVQWTWDGYTAVSAIRTCVNCQTTETAEISNTEDSWAPTCTENGWNFYIATATFPDGDKEFSYQTEEIPALGHSWDNGTVTKEATCTEDGEMTYTCTACKETKTEVIPAAGHTPVTDPAVEPTCTETGLTEGSHCSVCNEVLVPQEEIPALGHSWVESDEIISEDEDEIDIDVDFVCENCGATVERIVVRETVHDGITAHADFDWSDVIDLQTMIEILEDEELTIDFAVAVQDSNSEVPAGDESLVENLIQELWTDQDYTVYYLNIEVTMSTYDEDGNLVTSLTFEETINPITITVAIPDELLAAGADEYAVIRIHDGVAERIEATDNGDGTLTFSSDEFSTYAIVGLTDQSDSSEPDDSGSGTTGGTTGSTGTGTTGGTTDSSGTGTTDGSTGSSGTGTTDGSTDSTGSGTTESGSDGSGSEGTSETGTDTGSGSGSSTGSTSSGSSGSSGSGSSSSTGSTGSTGTSGSSGTSPQTDGPDNPGTMILWIAAALFAAAGCVMLAMYKATGRYRGKREEK